MAESNGCNVSVTVNNGSASSNTGNRQVRTGRQLVTIIPLPPGYHPPHVTHVQPGSQSKGYGGPGGHASRQWLSRITPVSSPPTVVTSPPSVTLMSVPFSFRTVAIPVHMLIIRPCTSPSQGCGYRRLSPHPHGSVGYDTRVA